MKFKLDENVDLRILARFRLTGYDIATVPEQKMTSAPDQERCLVTADHDFSNRKRYDPANYYGIVLIRLPTKMKLSDWYDAIDTLVEGLEVSSVIGKLWVIRNNSIQEYQPILPEENN
jgi:Domain of unknown function (DUF5615)